MDLSETIDCARMIHLQLSTEEMDNFRKFNQGFHIGEIPCLWYQD